MIRSVAIADMRPCLRPGCQRWFAPALRHPAQKYCRRACKVSDRKRLLVAEGRCETCGKDRGGEPGWRCVGCKAKKAACVKRLRADRRKAGECMDCGVKTRGGVSLCRDHKIKAGRRTADWWVRSTT